MTQVDWQRAESLFLRALETETEDREAFVQSASAGDRTLEAAVRDLLEAHQQSDGPLSRASFADLLAEEGGPESSRLNSDAPSPFYPYRLLEKIGHGGMGTVYLAERADERFEKKVAIKRLAPFLKHPELRRQFATERRALARLEHPNICRLLDAGEIEDGVPYVVMEYVDGEDLLRYCHIHRLSIEDRLDLFCQLCDAVQYAHQNLIVHRDIKPSNILVDRTGTPKLLDFGLAKLIEGQESEDPEASNPRAFFALTPDYASPEQWDRTSVSTASDIYSLGVLLHELLLGRRPYNLESASATEVARILAQPRDPPSVEWRKLQTQALGDPKLANTLAEVTAARRETARSLERKLAGDLDAVIRCALAKEPQQRYESAARLADDLRRWRQDRPITARSAGRLARLHKLVRRNRLASALIVALIGVTLVAMGSLIVQLQQVREARDRAVADRQRAEALSAMLIEGVAQSDPLNTSSKKDSAHAFLERSHRWVVDELTASPSLQVHLLNKIGRAYQNLGDYQQPIEVHQLALKIGQENPTVPPTAIASAADGTSTSLRLRGSFRAALPLAQEALAIREEVLGPNHADIATSLENLAEILHELSRFEDAGPIYQRALDIRRQHAAPLALATSLDYFGLFKFNTGDPDGALAAYSEAAALRRSHLPEHHILLARSDYNLAGIYLRRREYDLAEAHFRSALASYRQELGPGHPDVAKVLNDLALTLEAVDRFEEAEQLHRQALRLREDVLDADHLDIAQSALNLGNLLVDMERLDAAEASFDRCLAICRAVVEESHPYIGVALLGKGQIAHRRGRSGDAVEWAQQGVEVLAQTFGDAHWRTAQARNNLAVYFLAFGKVQEAEILASSAYEDLLHSLGAEDERTQLALKTLERARR